MKDFNDIMALLVFFLSVICLATTPHIFTSYTALDHVLAWTGVLCFSVYYLRDILARTAKRLTGFTTRSGRA